MSSSRGWCGREQQQLGLLSQDPLAIDAIISEPDGAKARAAADSGRAGRAAAHRRERPERRA